MILSDEMTMENRLRVLLCLPYALLRHITIASNQYCVINLLFGIECISFSSNHSSTHTGLQIKNLISKYNKINIFSVSVTLSVCLSVFHYPSPFLSLSLSLFLFLSLSLSLSIFLNFYLVRYAQRTRRQHPRSQNAIRPSQKRTVDLKKNNFGFKNKVPFE